MAIDPLLFGKMHSRERVALESASIEEEESEPAQSAQEVVDRYEDRQAALKQAEVESADPKNFKSILDQLDETIQAETGITPLNMDMVRSFVTRIMQDLKTYPDLDSILIDRDVHNVIKFIRTVRDSAVVVKEKTVAKRVAKSKKGGPRGVSLDFTDIAALPDALKDLKL